MERRDLTRRNDFATDSRGESRPLPRIAVLVAGHVGPVIEDQQYGSSEIFQHRLDRSTVVKTLNHIGYYELDDERRPVGSPQRRALGVAGDDPGAVEVVAEVIERFGYDTVRLDSLSAGRLLEPGGPVFGVSLRRPEFELALALPAEAAA
jgi:predicted dinucleotide-binding enzyme